MSQYTKVKNSLKIIKYLQTNKASTETKISKDLKIERDVVHNIIWQLVEIGIVNSYTVKDNTNSKTNFVFSI